MAREPACPNDCYGEHCLSARPYSGFPGQTLAYHCCHCDEYFPDGYDFEDGRDDNDFLNPIEAFKTEEPGF
jgi:hypothetical protein